MSHRLSVEELRCVVERFKHTRREVAAAYMLDVIRHARGEAPKPEVPWWRSATVPE